MNPSWVNFYYVKPDLESLSSFLAGLNYLTIIIHRRRKCSADLDLDRGEKEIDFGSGMKRLTFELDL